MCSEQKPWLCLHLYGTLPLCKFQFGKSVHSMALKFFEIFMQTINSRIRRCADIKNNIATYVSEGIMHHWGFQIKNYVYSSILKPEKLLHKLGNKILYYQMMYREQENLLYLSFLWNYAPCNFVASIQLLWNPPFATFFAKPVTNEAWSDGNF